MVFANSLLADEVAGRFSGSADDHCAPSSFNQFPLKGLGHGTGKREELRKHYHP